MLNMWEVASTGKSSGGPAKYVGEVRRLHIHRPPLTEAKKGDLFLGLAEVFVGDFTPYDPRHAVRATNRAELLLAIVLCCEYDRVMIAADPVVQRACLKARASKTAVQQRKTHQEDVEDAATNMGWACWFNQHVLRVGTQKVPHFISAGVSWRAVQPRSLPPRENDASAA